MSGWYRLERGWLKNEIFKNEPYCEKLAWIWLVETAVWRPIQKYTPGGVAPLQRGQLATSERSLCKVWGWKKMRVRNYLKRLEIAEMVTLKRSERDQRGTIITLCNYCKYQGNEPKEKTSARPAQDQNETSMRPDNEECKELEEGKNNGRASAIKPDENRKGQFIPAEWEPTNELTQIITERLSKSPQWVREQAEACKDYYLSQTGSKAKRRDWEATFRSWCRRAIKYEGNQEQPKTSQFSRKKKTLRAIQNAANTYDNETYGNNRLIS